MKMPAHNLTLQCSGHESRISDCRNDHKYQPTCQQNLNVACMPGTSELAIPLTAFTNSLQTEQWVNKQTVCKLNNGSIRSHKNGSMRNHNGHHISLENVQLFQRNLFPYWRVNNLLYIPAANCTDGQVRLVDGATDVEGRVEICFSRRWGTISGDGWTQTESTVVCNDLGYEATGKTRKNSTHYGISRVSCLCPPGRDIDVRSATNSMPVYLQGVRCGGRELSILECGFRKHLAKNIHGRDVAVQCKKCKGVDKSIAILLCNNKHVCKSTMFVVLLMQLNVMMVT